MKDTLVQHVVETYQPDAIILHGSRARGFERALSDWDIVLLYNSPTHFKSTRELFAGQNIEITVQVLPVSDIHETFAAKLQGAVVLYEKEREGSMLLAQARDYYAQGVHWSVDKIQAHKLWFQGRVDGMKHHLDTPEIFYKYFSDFYDRVFNYWYWLIRHEHSQPIYVALTQIEQSDPEYYRLIRTLTDKDSDLATKVVAAEQLRDRLFT